MTYLIPCYFSSCAPCSGSKDAKPFARVLTVPDCQDSGMVDNDGFLTVKKEVRFRVWTEIAVCDASTVNGPGECEPCEDENWLCRAIVGETAGARYKEWLG